ncbi:MAG: CHAT domain-containing protein [Candidatus Hodarchaeota archaeon]
MGQLFYLDFEIKIERKQKHYNAQVLRSPAGEASNSFELPFSEDRLELLILKLGRPRSSTRRIHSEEMKAAFELGGALFKAVFSGELLACLRSSLDEAYHHEGLGLRLKLRLQDVPELADLPWEFLFDPSLDHFFAQSNQTPIVRYIEMPRRIRALTINPPLQLLVMISSPTDYTRLNVEREKSLLLDALDPLHKEKKVQIEWLEPATLNALQRCSRDNFHVFHFIGHGGFDKKTEEGVLVLEDIQGRGWIAGAQRISTILHDYRSLRLAVLNSCEGARNSRNDPFAGVATSLIRKGIPAVVAMQFEITDEAAITFASEFYAALVSGYPVDTSVAEARKAIFAQPNDLEWGTPALYMRTPDGVLFNLAQISSEEKTPSLSFKPEAQVKEHKISPQVKVSLPGVRTLQKHTGTVWSVAFSPDGKTLASGSGHPMASPLSQTMVLPVVRLWRVSDGKLLHTLERHTDYVTSVAFSPDGKILASGGWDDTVRLWRVSDGKFLRTLEEHTHRVSSVAFSPDGKILASGGLDSTVRLCRVSDGKLLRTLQFKEWVESVAFSPDGKTLASGGMDKKVKLWRVSDGMLMFMLEKHRDSVSSVAFSPDGKILASGAHDMTVRLWRISDGELLHTLEKHKKWISSVAFSPDGKFLASGSHDATVLLWRVSDGKLLRTLEGHEDHVKCVAFSPDGKILASGSHDKTVRLWRIE